MFGLFGGSLLTGALISILGELLPVLPYELGLLVVMPLLLAILAIDLGVADISLPQRKRQVPLSISVRGNLLGPFQFGFEMGTGVRTYVTAAFPYALVGVLLLFGGWSSGLFAGVGFAAGRSLMPLLRQFSENRDGWDRSFERRLRSSVTACSITGSVLLVFVVA